MKELTKAAKPLELIIKGGDPEKIAVWACGTCRITARSADEALSCCAPWVCEECGKEVKSYCEDCSKKKQHAKEQEAYNKAEKVPYEKYSGEMIYCDHCENFYNDVDEFLDGHDDCALEDIPEWAWGTYEKLLSFDADDFVCVELENNEMHEDARDSISQEAIDEMQEFFNAWNKRNPVKSYFPDHAVVVDLEKEVEEYRKENADEAK
jgi:hypothetical protein